MDKAANDRYTNGEDTLNIELAIDFIERHAPKTSIVLEDGTKGEFSQLFRPTKAQYLDKFSNLKGYSQNEEFYKLNGIASNSTKDYDAKAVMAVVENAFDEKVESAKNATKNLANALKNETFGTLKLLFNSAKENLKTSVDEFVDDPFGSLASPWTKAFEAGGEIKTVYEKSRLEKEVYGEDAKADVLFGEMLVKVGSAVAETTEVLTAGSGGVAKKTLLKTVDELPDLSTGADDVTKASTKTAQNEAIKSRVFDNIAESKNTRESSNFKQYAAKENALLDTTGKDSAKNVASYERYKAELRAQDAVARKAEAEAKQKATKEAKKDVEAENLSRVVNLPKYAQDQYLKYIQSSWSGKIAGQSDKASAGKTYLNIDGKLPSVDSNGKKITYTEFDVEVPNSSNRGVERFVVGSDGSHWYTDSHYGQSKSINNLPDFIKIK